MNNLKDHAHNRWVDILSLLGIDRRFLVNKHGPCPMCEGTDRYRFDDKGDGRWICSHCGAGDGFRLLMLAKDVDFLEARRMVESVIGQAEAKPQKSERDAAEAMRAAVRTWDESVPLAEGHVAWTYLMRRVGVMKPWRDLRYHPGLPYERDGAEYPCLVALVREFGGKPCTIHKTFLTKEGRKADVPSPRKMASGISLTKGASVRLAAPYPGADSTIGIAEGLETAMSTCVMFGVRTWAALNAGNLASWNPPPMCERVAIFGDNDASFTGQAAAYALAKRLTPKFRVEVRIPEQPTFDWNDVRMAELEKEQAA